MKPRHTLDSRDVNEQLLRQTFLKLGALVEVIRDPTDLLVAWRGVDPDYYAAGGRKTGDWRQVLVEVKQPAGPHGGTSHSKLTDAQREFFERWPAELRCVCRTVDDVVDLVVRGRVPV